VIEVVLFFGSRGWTDREAIRKRIEELPQESVIVSGMAAGADLIAAECARDRGLHVAEVLPLWTRYGNAAGHKRNAAMARLGLTRAEGFWDGVSPGSGGMLRILRTAGIPTEVHEAESRAK
jgi:hypothetical protein